MSLWLWVILLMVSIMQKKARSKASYNNPAITPREINEGQELEICGNVIALVYPSTWDYPMWYVHLHESFGSYDRWEVMPVVRSFSEVMGKVRSESIVPQCTFFFFLPSRAAPALVINIWSSPDSLSSRMAAMEPTDLPPMSMRGRSVEDVRRCNKGIKTSESSENTCRVMSD